MTRAEKQKIMSAINIPNHFQAGTYRTYSNNCESRKCPLFWICWTDSSAFKSNVRTIQFSDWWHTCRIIVSFAIVVTMDCQTNGWVWVVLYASKSDSPRNRNCNSRYWYCSCVIDLNWSQYNYDYGPMLSTLTTIRKRLSHIFMFWWDLYSLDKSTCLFVSYRSSSLPINIRTHTQTHTHACILFFFIFLAQVVFVFQLCSFPPTKCTNSTTTSRASYVHCVCPSVFACIAV